VSIHCTVYRNTSSSGRAGREPWVTHSWWVTCKYDWGTVNTPCQTWQQAINHADREIASAARYRQAAAS